MLVIRGTYRGTMGVTLHVNPDTGLMVMVDAEDSFRSGWRLNEAQLDSVLNRGAL